MRKFLTTNEFSMPRLLINVFGLGFGIGFLIGVLLREPLH